MSNLEKFAKILTKMHDCISNKNWLSSIATSLDTYLKNLLKNREYLLCKEEINLCNEQDIIGLAKQFSDSKQPSNKPGKIIQRIYFYKLLGIFELKIKNIYIINKNNLTNLDYENVTNMFINEGICLFRSIIHNPKIKNYHISAIRIFTGFYIYSLLRIMGRDEFNKLKLLLDEKVLIKINEIDSQKKSQITNDNWTLDNTYRDFFNNHFSEITLEDLEKIYSYIFIEIDNYWYLTNTNISKFFESTENTVQKIKKVYDERKFKDVADDEIKKILRSNFNSDVKKYSNNESDIKFEIDYTIDVAFLESAHIVPISEIKSLCDKLINKDEELLKRILDLLCSYHNGALIPMNYHKFYDNQYIELSMNEPKFILTQKGINSIETLKILGYTENHNIRKNKYDEIMNTISEYKKMLNSTNN